MARDGSEAGGGRVGRGERVVIPWIRAEVDEAWLERRRRNPKRMGELSQAMFLRKASSLGFGVAVPWGDSEKYDFVVWAGSGERMLRVQVKATGRLHRRGYEVQPVYSTRGEGKKRYTAEEIDVLAAHVQPLDVWYLLPIGVVGRAKSLRFYPDIPSRAPRWEKYREKWDVLE
ncbi:MAG: group I intron-associated PD-(D/E)XK endonuclease [Candidatus Sulfotelmatobacter sp.]